MSFSFQKFLINISLVHFCSGYGLTIGYPTIVIPAVQGGDGRDASKGEFRMTVDEISWLSKCISITHFDSFFIGKILISRNVCCLFAFFSYLHDN